MSSCMCTAPHTRKNVASTRTVVKSCIAQTHTHTHKRAEKQSVSYVIKPLQVLHWSEILLRKMRPSTKKAAALLMSCGSAIQPTTPSMLSEENPSDLCDYHEWVQVNESQEKLIQYVKVYPSDRAGRGEQHTGW